MTNPNELVEGLLVLPRLRVQNANAISAPLTWGFPAVSAFLGLMQALERKLPADNDVQFHGVGVVCHEFEPQVSQEGYTRTFSLTRNPLGKDGNPPAFVEEGRAHLDISLVFGVSGPVCGGATSKETQSAWAQEVEHRVSRMRVAGGSVVPRSGKIPARQRQPYIEPLSDAAKERRHEIRRLLRRLLPGFCLVLREDILEKHWQALSQDNPEASRLEAWLDLSALRVEPVNDQWADGEMDGNRHKRHWDYRRPPGWVVPIPVGFSALSASHSPGTVAGARDSSIPFRFVEAVYSLGEWLSPHRLNRIDQFLWYVDADPDQGLYRYRNDYVAHAPTT